MSPRLGDGPAYRVNGHAGGVNDTEGDQRDAEYLFVMQELSENRF